MLVMVMIQAFLVFDYIKILTDGGPAHATEMLSMHIIYVCVFHLSGGKSGGRFSVHEYAGADFPGYTPG